MATTSPSETLCDARVKSKDGETRQDPEKGPPRWRRAWLRVGTPRPASSAELRDEVAWSVIRTGLAAVREPGHVQVADSGSDQTSTYTEAIGQTYARRLSSINVPEVRIVVIRAPTRTSQLRSI